MSEWIGICIFAAVWIGTLIYSTGKQNRFNDEITKNITRIENDVRELKQWGEKQVADRVAFNQANYLSTALFNECNKDVVRRLESIEEYKIDSRLATIETQLAHVLTILEELKRR